MTYEYITRSDSSHKQESTINVDAFAKLERNIMSNISNLKDEVINMKDTAIKSLLKEKVR